jgi:flagellin-like hook-associated protein FlgL
VKAQVLQTKGTRSRIADTDLTLAITQLSQLQLALQATLAAGSQIAQTSLTSLLRL